jgi:hypothetical protein
MEIDSEVEVEQTKNIRFGCLQGFFSKYESFDLANNLVVLGKRNWTYPKICKQPRKIKSTMENARHHSVTPEIVEAVGIKLA